MPQVKVTFFGICTHSVPQPGHWRVTLVNASQPVIDNHPVLKGFGIMQHLPAVRLLKSDFAGFMVDINLFQFGPKEVVVSLAGARLELNSALGTLVDQTACMPRLGTWLTGVKPGPAVTGSDATLTACHFDFQAGTVAGTRFNHACMAKVTVATSGPPQLRITPFGSATTTVLFLNDGASIGVSNAPDPNDKDRNNPHHFLLHYLSADGFPAGTVTVAEGTCPLAALIFLPAPAETPACSNAKY